MEGAPLHSKAKLILEGKQLFNNDQKDNVLHPVQRRYRLQNTTRTNHKVTNPSFDFQACLCDDRVSTGIMECLEDQNERLGVFQFSFGICMHSTTLGVIFEQIQQFGWRHGNSFERIQYENGQLVAQSSFLIKHGLGTNNFYLTGTLMDIGFIDPSFLWHMFKRSVRALRHNKMELSGVILASNANGEYEDVPFHFDIPVARFTPAPFLKEFPDATIFPNGDPVGCKNRRITFVVLTILTLVVLYCVVRDIISFIRLVFGCCTKNKKQTTRTEVDEVRTDSLIDEEAIEHTIDTD